MTLLIDNCSANGLVKGFDPTGGLIGGGRNFILKNSTMSGEVNVSYHENIGYSDNCGGLIGRISYHGSFEGYPGYQYSYIYEPFVVDNCYYKYSDISFNGSNMYTLGCLPDEMYDEWVANDYQLDIDDYLLSEDDTYLVSSVEDFKAISAFANLELDFRLEADIDLANDPNFTIPYFNGTFDGQNHVIRNLNIDNFNSNIALFGVLDSGSISNLIIEEAELIGQDFTGILAGYATGNVVNCHVRGSVDGSNCVGLLIGYLKGESTVNRCSANGLVHYWQYAGGLIGYMRGYEDISDFCVVSDCYSRGIFAPTGWAPAGLFAGISSSLRYARVENCYSTFSIDETSYLTHALFWDVDDFEINNCFWSEEVSGMTDLYGTGISEEAMQTASTFSQSNWDFTDIWAIDQNINDGFPYLLNQFPVPNSDEDVPMIELSSSIKSAYPNPFNPETTIEFNVKAQDKAHLSVYNLKGQLVKSFGQYRSGEHKVIWKGDDSANHQVSSGLYFIRLNTETGSDVRKVMLMK